MPMVLSYRASLEVSISSPTSSRVVVDMVVAAGDDGGAAEGAFGGSGSRVSEFPSRTPLMANNA